MANFNTKDYAKLDINGTKIGEIKDSSGSPIWRATYSSVGLHNKISSGAIQGSPVLTISGGTHRYKDIINICPLVDGGYAMVCRPSYLTELEYFNIFNTNSYAINTPGSVTATSGIFDFNIPYNSLINNEFSLIDGARVDLEWKWPSATIYNIDNDLKLTQPKIRVKSGFPNTYGATDYMNGNKIIVTVNPSARTVTIDAQNIDEDYYVIFIQYYSQIFSSGQIVAIPIKKGEIKTTKLVNLKVDSSHPISIMNLSTPGSSSFYTKLEDFPYSSTKTRYYFVSWTANAIAQKMYPFSLETNNTIVSTNTKVASSYSYAFLFFDIPQGSEGSTSIDFPGLEIYTNQSSERNYDYGIFSDLDSAIKNSYDVSDNTNVFNTLKGVDGNKTLKYSFVYADGPGTHFITMKYRKDGSGDIGNDKLRITNIKFIDPIELSLTQTSGMTPTPTLVIKNNTSSQITAKLAYWCVGGSSGDDYMSTTDNDGEDQFVVPADSSKNVILSDDGTVCGVDWYFVEVKVNDKPYFLFSPIEIS